MAYSDDGNVLGLPNYNPFNVIFIYNTSTLFFRTSSSLFRGTGKLQFLMLKIDWKLSFLLSLKLNRFNIIFDFSEGNDAHIYFTYSHQNIFYANLRKGSQFKAIQSNGKPMFILLIIRINGEWNDFFVRKCFRLDRTGEKEFERWKGDVDV